MTGKLVREKVSKWHFLQSIRKCFKPLRSRKVRKSEKINEKKAKKVYEKNLTKTDHEIKDLLYDKIHLYFH